MSEVLNATHQGVLKIGDLELQCYNLKGGKRVFHKKALANALALKSKGGSAFIRTVTRKNIWAELNENARINIENPIEFRWLGNDLKFHGYEADTLIDVLEAIMSAKLTKTQQFLNIQAKVILAAVAKVGIIALIDEATGFQSIRNKDALQSILDKYLQTNARKWARTFPPEFWKKLVKIKGYDAYYAIKRPAFVGHWVNDLVYSRLAPNILQKLKKINPKNEKGYRKNKHHQFTTADHGLPELKEHLIKIMTLMDAAANNAQFIRLLNRSLPRFNDTYEMPLDD